MRQDGRTPKAGRREKHKGPTILRGAQVDLSTTDQRLLDSRGPTDWVHADPWRGLRIPAEVVGGFGAPPELGPAVGGVGSAPPPPPHPFFAQGGGGGRRL